MNPPLSKKKRVLVYNFQFFLLMVFCALLFSFSVIYKKSKFAALGYFYLSCTALLNSFYPSTLYPGQNAELLRQVSEMSMRGFLYMSAIFGLVFIPGRKGVEAIKATMWLLSFGMAITCIVKAIMGMHAYSLMLNTSMEGNFFAIVSCLYLAEYKNPLSYHQLKFFFIPILLIATMATKSSIGIGGVGLSIGIYILTEKRSDIRWSWVAVAGALMGVAIFHVGPSKFFSDSARFICWEWSFDWWAKYANQLVGTGAGSYWKVGPWIQMVNVEEACRKSVELCEIAKVKYQHNNYYPFMHNDWGQILFEGGWVGFFLAVGAFTEGVINSQGRTWLGVGIIVYAVTSLMNMPAHYVLTAVLGLLLLRISTDPELKTI